MTLNLTNFLFSLASAMIGVATPMAPLTLGLGQNVFVNQAAESSDSKDAPAYAVLRTYGGPKPEELQPIPKISVQFAGVCSRQAEALMLSQTLFESLYVDINAGNGGPVVMRPRGRWIIAAMCLVSSVVVDDASQPGGWEVRTIELMQPPSPIGRDADSGKYHVVFNFDVKFEAKEA